MSKRTENDVLNGDGWNKDETSDSPEIKSVPEVGVKQGISIIFTLIVVIAIGAFIVKGYKASKNPESDTVAEQTTTEMNEELLTESISEDAAGEEHVEDLGEVDNTLNNQIEKDYFCYSDEFIIPGLDLLGEVCGVTVISNNEKICKIEIKTSSGNKFRTYDSLRDYDSLCEEDVFFPEVYSYNMVRAKDEADLICDDLLMVKEMDESHVLIAEVNLTYQFDEYSKIQTSDGVKYQTSDGSRYDSLLNVPHTIEVVETDESTTLYSELEIN